jgi:hypothetical protein
LPNFDLDILEKILKNFECTENEQNPEPTLLSSLRVIFP